MNLITIKNLSRHELRCEEKSFLGGSLQQDHEESFAVVDQLDPNIIENTSLEESDKSDIINEGTAEGSDLISMLSQIQKMVMWEHRTKF